MNSLAPIIEQSTKVSVVGLKYTENLGKQLEAFQRDTMTNLVGHTKRQAEMLEKAGDSIKGAVDAAVGGLKAQEDAFKAAARQAEQTFAAQTRAVDQAGKASAGAITNAGEAASGVLKAVQEQLVTGIQTQLQELDRLLRGLKALSSTFAVTDQGQHDALLALAERTDTSLKSLTTLSRELSSAAKAANLERGALTKLVEELMQAHGKLLQSESAALTEAVNSLLVVVNSADQLQRQASALAPRPTAPPRPAPTGGRAA
jgi:hypothetical protein